MPLGIINRILGPKPKQSQGPLDDKAQTPPSRLPQSDQAITRPPAHPTESRQTVGQVILGHPLEMSALDLAALFPLDRVKSSGKLWPNEFINVYGISGNSVILRFFNSDPVFDFYSSLRPEELRRELVSLSPEASKILGKALNLPELE